MATVAASTAAEITAMATIGAADAFGLPVSTTHVLSSGVAGTMAANHSGLQWGTVRNLLMAWVLTLPAAMMLSGFLSGPSAGFSRDTQRVRGTKKALDTSLFVRLYSPTVEETGRTGGFGPIAIQAQRIFATRSNFEQPEALPKRIRPASRNIKSPTRWKSNSLIVRYLLKRLAPRCHSAPSHRHYRAAAARTCTTGICWP